VELTYHFVVTLISDAVNGNWGEWGAWSACSEKEFCDLGEKKRTRKCDNPSPAQGGDLCIGLDTEDEICPKDKCKRKGLTNSASSLTYLLHI
jgi:hypothetical protein